MQDLLEKLIPDTNIWGVEKSVVLHGEAAIHQWMRRVMDSFFLGVCAIGFCTGSFWDWILRSISGNQHNNINLHVLHLLSACFFSLMFSDLPPIHPRKGIFSPDLHAKEIKWGLIQLLGRTKKQYVCWHGSTVMWKKYLWNILQMRCFDKCFHIVCFESNLRKYGRMHRELIEGSRK